MNEVLHPLIHTEETALDLARPYLREARKKFGFIPNLIAAMAESPPLLAGYLSLVEAFEQSTLTPIEQQVVSLTASLVPECAYGMSEHSMRAEALGMDEGVLDALREDHALSDPRLDALRTYTRELVLQKGAIQSEHVERALQAGYEPRQLLEVNLGVALALLSSYTHHLLPVPIDTALQAHAWDPSQAQSQPGVRMLVMGWVRPAARDRLAEYQAAAGPVMQRYGGRALHRMSVAGTIDGNPPNLTVIMRFPTREACENAFCDPEYTALLPLRNEVFERLDISVLAPDK